ncbi:MAG: hypothetical protein N2560_04705 [Ignavibacteria bacterium]|nr:hypothetical protein [Ignavibacteria bacterium]
MKFIVIFIYIFLLLSYNPYELFSQNKGSNEALFQMIMNSDTRTLFKLNGYWEASIDDEGFNSVFFPKVFYNCNKVTLRKIVHLDKQLIQNSVWHLYFLGVNDEIELHWNNQFLGRYVSDGSPLWITFPRKITIKEHNQVELVITKANPLAYQTRKNYLLYRKLTVGIPRDFFLVRTPLVWVNNLNVHTEFETLAKALLKAKINISSFEVENLLKSFNLAQQIGRPTFSLEVLLRNKETKQIVGQALPINFELSSFRNISFEPTIGITNPVLWDPDNPYLYELEVKISFLGTVLDIIRQDIGFTKWDTYKTKDGFGLLINGKPFLIKGVDFVEDFDYYISGNHLIKLENDLKNLKSLGANVVRFLFTSPNPLFISLANKYGIIVLTDLPVYSIPSSIIKKSDLFVRFQTIMENIIRNMGSNPSFFAIGFGENLDFTKNEVNEYIRRMASKIAQYPKIRKYIVYLLGAEPINFDYIDFYVAKDNFQLKTNEKILNALQILNSSLNKPVVFNFGTIIDPNNHNGYNDIMSVEYQSYYLNIRYTIRNQVGNAGIIYWSYNDYFTENPIGKSAKNEPYISYSGIISYNNQRQTYNMLKALFNNEETPVINPGQAETDFPTVYIFAGAFAFLLWGIMVNRSRRFREHTFRSLFRSYNFFADIRDRRLISNIQTATFGIALSVTLALFVVSILSYLKTNEIFLCFLNLICPNTFVKEWILKLSWQSEYFVLTLSILIYIKLFLLALILKFSSLFVRSKIFISDTYKMVVWSGTPALILLPIAIFINRILPISNLLGYIFIIVFIILILYWFLRLIKSVWIVFDIKPSKVYLISFLFIFVFFILYLSFLEYNLFFFEYVSHYSKWLL